MVNNTIVIVILVFLVHLLSLRVVDRSCGGGTSDGTFLGGVRCPDQKIVCSQGRGLLICGRTTCSVAIVVGRVARLSAVSLYRALGVSPRFLQGGFHSVGSHQLGPNCSPCAGRMFLARLSTRSYNVFRRGLFGFPKFCVRQHAVQRCACGIKTRVLKSVTRISGSSVRGSRCCVPNSFVNGLNMRHSCRGRLQKRGNVRVLLHSTQKQVRKGCVSKGFSGTPMTKGGLQLDLSVRLRRLKRHLLRKGVKDVMTVRPSANRMLYLISSPACSPQGVIKEGHNGGRLVLTHSP